MTYSIREALAAFRRAPALAGLSAALISLSLFIVGLFGVMAFNLRRAVERVESRVEIIAYLRDDASPNAVALAQHEIEAFPEVRKVYYVSRDEALENARRDLVEFRSVLADLDANPLPASFEVRLRTGQQGAGAVRAVAQRIATYPFVEQVSYGADWLDKVYLLRRVAGAATAVLGGAFAVVAALIIGAAVRLAIFARRDEIAIMRLVGATESFVQRPFLLEGLLTGLAGGAIALGATFGLFQLLSGTVFAMEWIPLEWIAVGLAFGGLLGVAASAHAVRRHLREI
ncbi:MAG TPA: permease-like cell division protein FtsX [Longimicrobiales bacterium]|nr:permease-like cell division protein FtsX [Longimicrobiales bacterium]